MNPLHWRGLVETANFYAVADVNLAGDFDPTRATILTKPDPSPALDAARRTHTFREFLIFTQFPFWRVEPLPEPEGAQEVRLTDMRFRNFVARASIDASLRVLNQSFQWNFSGPK